MNAEALLLVLLSAAIHVGWNVVARSARGSASFPWLVNVAGALVLAPIWVVRRLDRPLDLPAPVLGLAALSALFETAYFVALHSAYGRGELSSVYPLSRGVAPLLALVPARLLSGDDLSSRELLGLALVVAGTVGIAASGRGSSRRALLLALAVGAAIAAYQVVDHRAMQLAPAGAELEYLATMQTFLAVLLTAWWWSRAAGRARSGFPPVRVTPDQVRRALLAAIGVQAAYFLILLALREADAALVAAVRNVGIPMSLAAGALLLRERVDRARVTGSIAIVAGLLVLY